MRFLRHSLTGLFLLSLTLGLLTYGATMVYTAVSDRLTRQPQTPERHERAFAVNVSVAHVGTVTPVLTAFGQVQSRRSLEIRARTGGALIELAGNFEEGGVVSRGQLLAVIDPADAQSALDRAQSDVMDAGAETRDADRSLVLARDEQTAAEAQADLRERAFQRQVDLEERGVGTAAAVETAELAASQARQAVLARRLAVAAAEARVDQAANRVARARIALAEAQRRLDETRITAEFSGALAQVAVVEGGVVTANERLANLVDAAALEVAFRVSTPQFARLLDTDGRLTEAPVTVTLDAFGVGLTATGTISRASPAVGEGQTGRLVFAGLDAAQGLKPGDFVTVGVDEPPLEQVVRLPAAAYGADGLVLVLGPDDRLEALSVTLLRRQGDEVLVRGEGLDGREVVGQRSPLLGPGIKVRPVRRAADGAVPETEDTVELSADRRARLVAFVQNSTDMSEAVKTRLLDELDRPRVPVRVVQRLENRMGG